MKADQMRFPHIGLPADFPLEILEAAKEGTPDYWLGYLAGRKADATPPESGGQGEAVAEGVMFGRMESADFEADTVTFRMEPGYYAAAGRYRIAPHALTQGGGNGR